MNGRRLLVIAICALLFIGSTAMAEDINLDDLFVGDTSTRSKTEAQLRARNGLAVNASIRILNDGSEKGEPTHNQEIAFRVLGALRDPRAVGALCRCIELRRSIVWVSENRPTTIGDWYPAAGALAKIGKPVVRQCLWELTKENSDQRRECFCWVVGAVEGPEVGRFVFQLAIDKETDATRKARLQAALPVFEKLFPLEEMAEAAK